MLKKLAMNEFLHKEYTDLVTDDGVGTAIATISARAPRDTEYIARRLTAAWNATRHIPLEDLEREGVAADPLYKRFRLHACNFALQAVEAQRQSKCALALLNR